MVKGKDMGQKTCMGQEMHKMCNRTYEKLAEKSDR